MPRQQNFSVENNFSKGLLTEHTALNFPENACTETFNCIFDNLGNVSRRLGFDYEPANGAKNLEGGAGQSSAISTFIWNNAGGDGGSTIYVLQVGQLLNFYYINAGANISAHPIATIIVLGNYKAPNVSLDSLLVTECQYAEGNGYLFVFNDFMRPIFCSFNPGNQVVTATPIDIKIRDFAGVEEVPPLGDSERPTTLSATHQYNIANQGWGNISYSVPVQASWNVDLPASNVKPGTVNIGVETGNGALPIKVGDRVTFKAYIPPYNPPAIIYVGNTVTGTVTSFEADGTLLFTSTAISGAGIWNDWILSPDPDILGTWLAATGIYPSNADVWWQFKDSAGVFNPALTYSSNLVTSGPAPKGHFILDAFNQDRATASGVPLGAVICNTRPRTGAWYAGRLWAAGADGGPPFTENVYFSQIVENNSQFSKMYQVNDPTAEDTFDLLPSDGGVIKIAGCGAIRKLFAIQSGMLVFTANGVWFIAGNQGIGFTANDYSVSKISEVRIASASSFVSVLGLPAWWNDEGIYMVQTGERGGLNVVSLTDSTIASFFKEISFTGKRLARGSYNPLTQTIQWCYSNGSLVEFNRILNYNVSTQTFYPWAVEEGLPKICGINFVYTDPPVFKYLTKIISNGTVFTLSEERNESYLDWVLASTPVDYSSYFITGYKLHGQAQRKFQSVYVNLFMDSSQTGGEFFIRGIWDFSSHPNSGRWSTNEKVDYTPFNFNNKVKRVKVRGAGKSLQFMVESTTSKPFNLIGWGIVESASRWV